ncbi:MAG: nicotinamidase [Spirochaetales bacterium]|nr:nicotinamidase [Spirochaetales bacterium]
MTKSALIVIDMQNDFFPGGALGIDNAGIIIPAVNNLSMVPGLCIASQDWHPADHISFTGSRQPNDTPDNETWPAHCIAGTSGAEFHPSLETENFNLILRKGTNPEQDSYSVFYENDHVTSSGLSFLLKGLEVQTVFLCGLAYDVCVKHSALDAIKDGFRTVIIEDAVAAIDSSETALGELKSMLKASGVNFIKQGQII